MENQKLIELISKGNNLNSHFVSNVIKLLDEGSTIPFISRYRKEATGNMDEVMIQNISESYLELKELVKRKDFIIETIDKAGKLTSELRDKINDCWSNNILEDIYLPYKQKRRTRAEIARNNGLEPLAKIIMSQHGDDINYLAKKYTNDNVPDSEDAIKGASDIISEWVSENETARYKVRTIYNKTSQLVCKAVKGKEVEGNNYENYFDASTSLKRMSSHRLLAMLRGVNEGFLKLSVNVDTDEVLDSLNRTFIKGSAESSVIVEKAIKDSYSRLIKPSIETEILAAAKERADIDAIDMFAQNLRQLLFTPPLGHKRVLGVDPGYRTGCKIVCLDAQGNLLHNDVIYPNPPQNDKTLSSKKVLQLIESYKIEAVAIGNGTASRETESFFSSLKYKSGVQIFVVNENGASIYSASKIAREEFPDKDVTVRGAVSIGRRLIDSLAELIKIDPKSIGVGQYQHDVDQAKLKRALDFTVDSCVNNVGVNVNTASQQLLTHVAGLGPQLAKNIVEYRAMNGDFKNRNDLLNVPRMGQKAFQQAAGFLRIPDGDCILDNTAVHPESYPIVKKMSLDCNCSLDELVSNNSLRSSINLQRYLTSTIGMPTLKDIMAELEKPGRDPRDKIEVLEFDDKIRTIDDVREGMILNGIVTNLTQFGAFVDFGIKENGLVHISEMSNSFISSPTEILKLHEHVKVRVLDVDTSRKRISLSLKGIE